MYQYKPIGSDKSLFSKQGLFWTVAAGQNVVDLAYEEMAQLKSFISLQVLSAVSPEFGDAFLNEAFGSLPGSFLNVDNQKWDNYIRKFAVNAIPQVNLFDRKGNLENRIIDYKNNKLDNKWTYWADDGRKTEEITYNNGIKNGSYVFWNFDNYKTVSGEYLNGVKHGLWTLWYDDGIIKAEENYANGEMDGLWSWWRPDGIKDQEGNYKNGVKHGLWISWGTADRKKGEETYVN